jgi:hypothetical protein
MSSALLASLALFLPAQDMAPTETAPREALAPPIDPLELVPEGAVAVLRIASLDTLAANGASVAAGLPFEGAAEMMRSEVLLEMLSGEVGPAAQLLDPTRPLVAAAALDANTGEPTGTVLLPATNAEELAAAIDAMIPPAEEGATRPAAVALEDWVVFSESGQYTRPSARSPLTLELAPVLAALRVDMGTIMEAYGPMVDLMVGFGMAEMIAELEREAPSLVEPVEELGAWSVMALKSIDRLDLTVDIQGTLLAEEIRITPLEGTPITPARGSAAAGLATSAPRIDWSAPIAIAAHYDPVVYADLVSRVMDVLPPLHANDPELPCELVDTAVEMTKRGLEMIELLGPDAAYSYDFQMPGAMEMAAATSSEEGADVEGLDLDLRGIGWLSSPDPAALQAAMLEFAAAYEWMFPEPAETVEANGAEARRMPVLVDMKALAAQNSMLEGMSEEDLRELEMANEMLRGTDMLMQPSGQGILFAIAPEEVSSQEALTAGGSAVPARVGKAIAGATGNWYMAYRYDFLGILAPMFGMELPAGVDSALFLAGGAVDDSWHMRSEWDLAALGPVVEMFMGMEEMFAPGMYEAESIDSSVEAPPEGAFEESHSAEQHAGENSDG